MHGFLAKEMGQMTLFHKKIPVYTLDKKVWQSVLMYIQEKLERGTHMEHDNHIRLVHKSSAAQIWAFCCLFSALLLLLDDAVLYALPSPWMILTPFGFLSPFLALAVGITGIGSVATAFKKTVATWIRVLAIVSLVLSLLSLVFYFFVYVFYTSCLHGC